LVSFTDSGTLIQQAAANRFDDIMSLKPDNERKKETIENIH